ncbi:MAG: hypothetical protein CBB68_15090 [Rhodospirillaceae bacterium TMED8]|nr:peptidase M16 [Magnetovibrio sp.]OUT47754.1 MAG: hypothetical protein CBB68_15090 [Rhodospirillaceae bacterium TMED8]|tara:strand:- start:204 stop:1532 length:1329 start_codon:yes stop_codon:yes gene_type:complete
MNKFIPFLCFSAFALSAVSAKPASTIEVKRVTSPHGITAWLTEDHKNPIIDLRFSFRGGTSLDPKGKEGLTKLVSKLLDEGAGKYTSTAFRKILEDRAIQLSFNSSKDSFSGQLRTLTRDRDQAFNLLKLALTEPRFDAEPVNRIRAQTLVGIRQADENPHTLATRTLIETVFAGHPYARPSDGTEKSVSAISPTAMRKFVINRLARDNLVIGVVGDISAKKLSLLLDITFGKLPEKSAPWKLSKFTPLTLGKTIVVNRDIPQSQIVFADHGVLRQDPDFYAAYVMNRILGSGGFTSRLYREVREERGLAYSVFTSLYPLDAAGLLFASAATANARVSKTIKVVRDEWERMAASGVTKKELADAQTYLTGAWPLKFSSNGRIARMLVDMQMANLSINYLNERNQRISAVTLSDIKRVAKKLLDINRLTTIVVGDPEGVPNTN